MVALREPDKLHSLLGRACTVTVPGYMKAHRELTDSQWLSTLEEVFGLTFTPLTSSGC
jgi:hypothetical protein